MAKFILSKVTLDTSAPTASGSSPDVGIIQDVIVEASLPTIEPNQVTVDNGQVINESYTVNIEMRTKNTAYTNTNSILDNTYVSANGTLPTKVYIKFEGTSNSFDIDSGAIYLSGYEDYSNGRIETVLSGTLEVISATSGLTSS